MELPSCLGFKTEEVAVAAIDGRKTARAVVDASDGIVDKGVVTRDLIAEVIVCESSAEFCGEVIFGVDVGGAV